MGVGWCFTFIPLVCIVFSPLLWVEMKWGPQWREARIVRMEKLDEEKRRQHIAADEEIEAKL